MNTVAISPHPRADSGEIGRALFALGVTLPLFAGGNTLWVLDPQLGLYVFDLVSIVVTWRLVRLEKDAGLRPGRSTLVAGCSLAVLTAWWIGSLAFRPSGPRAFMDAQAIVCGALLFASLSRHELPPDAIGGFLRGLLLGALGTVLFSQYQYWIAFPRTAPLVAQMGIHASVLVNANFYNTNCYAVFLGAVTLLAAPAAIRDRDPIAQVAILLFVATILLSQSRSVIGLLGLGALVLVWSGGLRPGARERPLLSATLWILLPAAAGAGAAMVDLEELWGVATLGRVAIWRAALAMFRDHWLFGVGLGGFGDFFPNYRLDTYYTRYPHSFLLEIGAELGVVGLVGIVGFLVAALLPPVSRVVAATRGPGTDITGSLLSSICTAAGILLVHGLIDIDWHAPANPILLFVLLGTAQQLGIPAKNGRAS